MRLVSPTGEDMLQAIGYVGVLVEPEDRIRLGQLAGQFDSISLGHAPDCDDSLRPALILQVGRRKKRVDRVLLRLQVFTTTMSASVGSTTN